MNNAITEIKIPLGGINTRIIEAEDRISEMEDRMVKINAQYWMLGASALG